MSDVRLDDAAINDLLTDEHGMVGELLSDLAGQAAIVARGRVAVRGPGSTWSDRSDARPPGFTKAGIYTAIGHSTTGNLWASANAPADPTIFLEDPRVDRQREPFLTTGLDSLEGTL